jgi:hypothetical protein
MNASDIINGLIKAGVAIKDALSKSQPSGDRDFTKLLQTITKDEGLNQTVTGFLAAIKPNDVTGAIKEIDAKQVALLNGRKVADLQPAELLQYSDLADARLLLATRQLVTALNPSVLQWLVDEALPTLVDIAPTVIPLLL